jgi:hypothetical protein
MFKGMLDILFVALVFTLVSLLFSYISYNGLTEHDRFGLIAAMLIMYNSKVYRDRRVE